MAHILLQRETRGLSPSNHTILRIGGADTMDGAAYFPWDDVLASKNHTRSEERHSVEDAQKKYLRRASPCPQCGVPAERLSWIYLLSPEWTWQTFCGKAGWITVCDECKLQIDFFPEIMN